jgi:Uri superfamily endonuclease
VNNAPLDSLSRSGRGTYALLLRLDNPSSLLIGKLGAFDFRVGFYIYVGSAMGPGGIAGRLKHHLSPIRKPHWHVDYLRQAARVEEVWFVESDARREHAWSSVLLAMPGSAIPVPRFGASDCRCASHLFYFIKPPSLNVFQAMVDSPFPLNEPIRRQEIGVLPWVD